MKQKETQIDPQTYADTNNEVIKTYKLNYYFFNGIINLTKVSRTLYTCK